VYSGTAAHELMHALGFYHEQSRPDRDNYVKVNYQNIDSTAVFNFDKVKDRNTLGLSYDIYSILHYAKNAFSKNGFPTIEPLDPSVVLLHSSQKTRITDTDLTAIRILYNCPRP